MLSNLHVKNLALIDETEVYFGGGLNILSGETGAGKSIIIGSINLALGEKVPKELLKENTDSSFVELVFDVDKQTEQKLLEMDIFPEDGKVIMSRRITNGHSVAKVNSETVTASKLKEISSILIDIHGQHEHQSLLQKKKHMEILDSYAKEELASKKESLREQYDTYRKLKEEFENSNLDEEQRLREISFLEFEIAEIEEANLHTGEDEELETEYRRLAHGKKIIEAAETAYQYTNGQAENATELVSRANRELQGSVAYDDGLKALSEQIATIESLLTDFNHDMSRFVSDADFSEEHFYKIEKRLNLVNSLKAKYGTDIGMVLKELDQKRERLDKLKEYDVYLTKLGEKKSAARESLEQISEEVSAIRKKYAETMTKDVKAALLDLNFLNVEFEMEFEKLDHFTANGIDDAQFMISVNPGEPLRPLNKIASGGELSRIMLGLKTVLAENDEIPTLIFDEIDTGISGRTAQAVSEKLHVISKKHQVICITHLPQIAAMADHHFLIEKAVVGQNTQSTIYELDDKSGIRELARMLGGVKITDTVMESAREMKELAKNTK